MPINYLSCKAFNELSNDDQEKDGREDIKDTLQQHGLTINNSSRQARARILRISLQQRGREQQPQPCFVNDK
jgi:hypothetical protein